MILRLSSTALLAVGCALAEPAQNLLAQSGQLDVAAQANIYGAGHATAPGPAGSGAGSLPPVFQFVGPVVFTFEATGQVSYNGANFYGADGAQFLGGAPTDMTSFGGISGIAHDSSTMFLVGVFLNDQEPGGDAPSRLQFSYEGFTDLAPSLNQTFFIGDGWTGNGIGTVQRFSSPTDATRLFLGFSDGNNFKGLPGTYADNVGSLHVNYTIIPVPEPSVVVITIAAGACFLIAQKRRFTKVSNQH